MTQQVPLQSSEWHQDEAFWKDCYPILFPERRFTAAAGEVTDIFNLVGKSAGPVLDLCCGPGRHAIEFARQGHETTGVDSTAFLLEKAQALAARRNITVKWIHQDSLHYKEPNCFSLITNLYNSFGYHEKHEDNQTVLQNIFESLKPGGHFVIELLNKNWLLTTLRANPEVSAQLDDQVIFEKYSFNLKQTPNRLIKSWISSQRAVAYYASHEMYTSAELKELLKEIGFNRVTAYANLKGKPVAEGAPYFVITARKD